LVLSQYILHSRAFIYYFSSPTHKHDIGIIKVGITSSKPLGPINIFGQSKASVRLCSDFCQSQHLEQK
jgi:hypothetical protein